MIYYKLTYTAENLRKYVSKYDSLRNAIIHYNILKENGYYDFHLYEIQEEELDINKLNIQEYGQ